MCHYHVVYDGAAVQESDNAGGRMVGPRVWNVGLKAKDGMTGGLSTIVWLSY